MTNLLLQVLFVIFPLLLYHAWLRSMITKDSGRRAAFAVACALAAIVCMSNPIQIFPEFLFYITTVPWVLSFVYGGMAVGMFVTLAMMVCYALIILLHIDYQLPYLSYFGVYGITLAFILLLRFRKKLSKHRLLNMIVMTVLNTTLLILAHWLLQPDFTGDLLILYVCYVALNVSCAWLAAYLIEFMIERDKLVQEVQRAEKMKVIGQLAASVAHEVRNPMTVVRGFLQIMYDSPETTGKYRNYVALMLAEMDRAQDIISEYLSLAKPTADQASTLNLQKVLISAKESIIPYALLKNVHLSDKEPPGEYWITGNEEKVKQVFLNLLKNAIEANPAGGNVTTRLHRDNGYIAVEIKDNGVGMSKEQLDLLGMPFYSTKEQGTGLGLMVCYSIIHAMGGKILAESEKGMGTKFTVLLPELQPQTLQGQHVG